MSKLGVPLSLVLSFSCLSSILNAQGPGGPPLNLVELHRDVSPPLKDIEPQVPRRGPMRSIPLLTPPRGNASSKYADPVLQTTTGPLLSVSSGIGIEGVGDGFTGLQGTYSVAVTPPDTNGAVGSTQYVQWVNTDFAIFDKTTGNTLYGPVAGTTLWSGFGGPCQSTNDGDVIAQYDKLANRWVMAQLSYSQAPPYLLCIAISQTSDAKGSYYRYSLSYSGLLNDYPKVGIWPDAYYVTSNMFSPILGGLLGYTFKGPEVCALNRNNMLSGGPSTPLCQGPLSTSYSSLLASDLDGSTPPPAGSPNYVLGLGSSGTLYLWKFSVNFGAGTSTLSGPTSISVPAFNEACAQKCIPQAGSSQVLDGLGDRLMYRLAYRNQGGTEILLANHSVATTVNGTSTVGVRWYEIHNPNGTPSVYQSGTWAPDTNFRWLGSIAMDHSGDIALGYSESGGINPAIFYTGRQPSDPLGTMESENNIFSGAGAQASTNRWGDYSAMSVDPVDDCTFYYTNEYLATTSNLWHTRIASFSFANCTTTPSPDFSISASPASQSITHGSDGASYTVTLTSLNGYNNPVSLTVAGGCPSGATCTLSPGSVTPTSSGASSTLSVTGAGLAPAGNYTIVVNASDGTLTHQTSVTLAITDFSVTASPASQTITQGSTASYTVTVTSVNGFAGSVSLAWTGCPSGASCSVSSPITVPANGSAQSTLSVVTTSSTPTGTYSGITVTVTNGGTITHGTSVSLTVNPPAAADYSISANPTSLTIQRGKKGTTTITITPSGGFSETVNLSAGGSGCPPGSCTLTPSSVGPGSWTSILTIFVSTSTPRGNYTVTVSGISSPSGIPHSTSIALKVPK